MSSTLTPPSSPDDALCLQDAPSVTDLAISQAPSFHAALSAACLELCEGRPDLLAHALWSPREGVPLAPLGKLFGEEAMNHGELASALYRIGHEGTALTAAALRTGLPVWTTTIPRLGWKGLGRVLRDHGIKSGGAFPMVIGERVGAVIELLSFDKLQADLASDALAADIAKRLAEGYDNNWIRLAG